MTQEPSKVTLTRRRWDLYMLSLFVATGIVAGFTAWQTGLVRFATAPFAVLPLWMMLRFQTPADGMEVTTIRSTPGAVAMLWCCAAAIVLFAGLLAIDICLFGHPFRAPLETYHFLLFSPPFIIMVGGGFVIDRIQKAMRNRGA